MTEQAPKWGVASVAALLGLSAVYIAMRAYNGAAICMDGDEIFSVGVASHDWRGLMQSVGQDSIHPPLFYFLLKFWIAIGGDSLRWVRLLPTLFSTLAIVPVVLLSREFRLRPAIVNTTIGLAAIHPFLIYYSQHVRMYTLLMLCATASLWAFQAAIRTGSRTRWVALTAVNIVSVNAHYYGWLVLGLECAYVLLWERKQWKRIAASSAVVLAGFLPWAVWVSRFIYHKGGLASNLEWIQKPDAGALAWFFVDLAGFGELQSIGKQAIAGMALLVLAAAFAAWLKRARLHDGHFLYIARFLLFFVLGSVAVAFTASRLLPSSVWGHRHMVYLVFPILLLVVAAYFEVNSRIVWLTGGVLCAAWAFMVVQHHLKGDDKKTPFDHLVIAMLAQEEGNPDRVPFYSVDKYLHYPVWFYLETLKAGKLTGFAAEIHGADRPRLAAQAARIDVKNHVTIDDARGRHFWVGYSSSWSPKESPEAALRARGCKVGDDVTVKDRYHSSTVFPAWCGE